MLDIKGIKERLEKATPGPWAMDGYDEGDYFHCDAINGRDGKECIASHEKDAFVFMGQHNLEFIDNAYADIKALLEEVERLRKVEKDGLILPGQMDTAFSTLSSIETVLLHVENDLRDGYSGDCWETLEGAAKSVRNALDSHMKAVHLSALSGETDGAA